MTEILEFNDDLEVEVQTDKEMTKEVPCRGCHRRLIVSTFYAPVSAATCMECKGTNVSGAIAAPVAGKSDPSKVQDLKAVLVNHTFGQARCPVHPDDEEHEMELKMVAHAEQYGPSEFIGFSQGKPMFRQLAVGETVMHQCLKCKATVTYSTTAQSQFRRQNEVRDDKHINGLAQDLGVREEATA
jgi:hypothetical protein